MFLVSPPAGKQGIVDRVGRSREESGFRHSEDGSEYVVVEAGGEGESPEAGAWLEKSLHCVLLADFFHRVKKKEKKKTCLLTS